jgi:DNA topoisomerase II
MKNENDFVKKMKLRGTMATSNLVLFDKDKRLRRYSEISLIIEEHYEARLALYQTRKEYLLSKIERDLQILDNKQKFILEVIADTIIIKNRKRDIICEELKKKGYV